MAKKYLLKIFLLCILLMQVFTKASAQYAIGGSAGTNLVNSVYWLTWDQSAGGSTLISQPIGANGTNIISGTYVWQFSPTVRITAVISNLVTTGGTNMFAYTPGSYSGDGLDLIFSANNQEKPNSRGVTSSGIAAPYGGTATFDIDVKVAILINGVYTDVIYPGMIIADAESIDAGGEYISGTTPNAIAWQLLNKRTQNNAADDHYLLELSNSGRSFRLFTDLLPGNFGVQAVMFAHGARNLNNVSMKGSGLTAMAIGFVLPFDLGDNPLGYGATGHYMEQFQITDYFGGDGIYPVVDYATTPLIAKASVFIGPDNVDPDGEPVGGANANNDNLTGADDENSFNPANLPNIKVNQAGAIEISMRVTNTKNVAARLRGWLDFNGDGIFGPDEQVSVAVPANANNQNFTLTYPNSLFRNTIKTGPLYSRFRITTNALTDDTATPVDERSTSFASDGETEDYRLKDVLGVTISGSVFNDGNGGKDGVISGEGLQDVSGQMLFAYLIDNTNTIVNKAPVAADGSYALTNVNNGTYRVAISTNDVAVGGSLSTIPANLPANWQPSGGSYGTNNQGHTGIEPGTPNLQIEVVTPGTSLNVTGVNFGINQIPVAVADQGSTRIGTAVTLDIPGNDTDADGTIDPTKVLLIDPADNVKKTSVTVAGQGTYTVNPANGRVTFTPLPTFTGKTVPLPYTIKDNYGSESVNALITIDVKPVGVNDRDTTLAGVPVSTNVKLNDGTSATNATVTATSGTNGTTAVDGAGNIIYTPNPGFTGNDSYTYFLTTPDGVVSDPITVNIVVYSATLNLTKVANNGASAAGDVINYTLVLTNSGAAAAVNITITDPGADPGSISPANIASLAAGASATITARHTLTQAEINSGSFSNQAAAAGRDQGNNPLTAISDDPAVTGDNNPTVVAFAPPGAITLTKVANNGGSAAGDVINYTLVVTNTGGTALTNVTVTDAGADAGSISPASIASLAIGASATVTARHTLTQAEVNSGSFTNQASVTGRDPSNNTVTALSDDPTVTGNNNPTVVTLTPPGAISLTKVANNGGSAAGDVINYTLVVTNTGTTPLTGVVVTDAGADAGSISPANIATLAAGASSTVTARHTLTQTEVNSGSFSNQASVTGRDPLNNAVTAISDDPTVTGNTNPTVVTLTPPGSISLTKVANNGGSAAGDVINYTLVVTNTGTTPLTNVVITDAGADAGSILPANIASLAAGASSTVTARHTLTQAEINSGSFTNQATATGRDPGNNAVTAVSDDPNVTGSNNPTVVSFAAPGAVTLIKRGEFTQNYIIYTFVIRNTGASPLTAVTFSDPNLGLSNTSVNVPAGGLLPGDSVSFNYTYTLTQADKNAGVVNNTASVTARDTQNNLLADDASAAVTVPAAPVAANDASIVFLNTPKVITILNNDNPGNSEFDPQSIEILTQPQHGKIEIGNGVVTYIPDPDYSGPDEFTYRVKDLFGYYTNPATVNITVSPNTTFKIPTLFTPNGDGINDVFEIRGLEEYPQNELTIVNRWGNEVFRKKGYDNSWAGTGLNEGTYYYILRVLETNGTNWTVYKGYVTLIRTLRK